MQLLALWQQKRENAKIVNWLYELGEEERLGELPQFVKYRGKKITRYHPMQMRQDILDIELCHKSFKADYWEENDGQKVHRHVENIRGGYRCASRLCPICETIKARQEYTRLTWKMNQIKDDYDFFFLTLTLKSRKENFWELIQCMNYCSKLFRRYFASSCKGVYGTWEVTYNEKEGFHPHLHMIMAFPKGCYFDVKKDKKGSIKNIVFNVGKRDKITSQYDLVDKYREYIQTAVEKLQLETITPDHWEYPHLDFRQCYNIDNDVRELCKYFIDSTKLPDKEAFVTYCQSIYHVKRKTKCGVLAWTKENEADWKKFIDELHESIRQNKNSKRFIFEFKQGSDLLEFSLIKDYPQYAFFSPDTVFRLKYSVIKKE